MAPQVQQGARCTERSGKSQLSPPFCSSLGLDCDSPSSDYIGSEYFLACEFLDARAPFGSYGGCEPVETKVGATGDENVL